ncbi:MAG TPA: flippase [Candidatus Moranbacteria bacterium]|nr:flippase [Candidatus Moranbacteria bacterium]
MVIARKIAYNVLVSSISKILATVLALVSIGLITRYLGKDGFGNYSTVIAFFAFFTALSDLGLSSISTREISRNGADEEKIMGNVFTLRVATALLVVIVSPAIIFFFPYDPEVKRGILVAALAFFFSSSYQILNGVFQKNLAIDKIAFSELIGKLIQVSGVFLAIKFGLGFDWIIASLLAYMIASFLMIFFWSKKYIKIRLRFNIGYWKEFLKESYPIGAVTIITFIYFKIDTIMLSLMRTSADVGIYNAAYKIIENITFFPGMIMGLIFPIMSHSIFSDREKFQDISNKTFKVFLIFVLPLVVGTVFLSDGIINLIGGAGFFESANVLRILVFSLAFIFFGNFFNAILISGNQQKKLMYILALAAVINVSLNYILISKFSYFGAAWVAVATEFFVASGTFLLVFKKIKYMPKAEKFLGIAGAAFFMGLVLYLSESAGFFARGFMSVATYMLFLWVFKAVKTEEITSIISKRGIKEYEEIS